MPKNKHFTIPQLKKKLNAMTREDLIALFAEVYKGCTPAAEFIDIKLTPAEDGEALVKKYTEKIEDALFGHSVYLFDYPQDGPKKSREILKEFSNACSDPYLVAELKIQFVDFGLQLMSNVSDVEDPLRQLVINNYYDACDYASGNRQFYEKWNKKFNEARDMAKKLEKWDEGFSERMLAAYDEIEQFKED